MQQNNGINFFFLSVILSFCVLTFHHHNPCNCFHSCLHKNSHTTLPVYIHKANADQLLSASRHSALKQSADPEVPPSPPVRARSSTISPARLTCPTETEASSLQKSQRSSGVFMSAPRYPSLMLVTDEFSSQGSDRDYQATMNDENAEPNIKDRPYYAHPLPTAASGSRCKALYDYEANMYDELTIRTGNFHIHIMQLYLLYFVQLFLLLWKELLLFDVLFINSGTVIDNTLKLGRSLP